MSGFSRVSISESLRRTIRDIKEIAGEHSDEDVYAMLKECNMDPNETAQKLLFLDTFHEVKSKRERRKVNITNRANEEYGRKPGMQQRGTRGGRESYPSYNSKDGAGGRQSRQENGFIRPVGRASKSFNLVQHRAENKTLPAVTRSAAPSNCMTCSSNGSSSHEVSSQLTEGNIGDPIKNTKDGNYKTRKLPSLSAVVVKQIQNSNPGPTPTPTPTPTPNPTLPNTSNIITEDRVEGGSLTSKSSQLASIVGSPSVSGLYSSASDPVLVPSLNPRNSGAVGIIKRETGNHRNASEISNSSSADTKMNATQNGTIGEPVSGSVELTSNSMQLEYQGVERSQGSEPGKLPPSRNHLNAAAIVNQDTSNVRSINDPVKEMISDGAAIASESNLRSLHTPDDPSSTQATSEVDVNVQKLHISEKQPVIFPNHLHVPEALKNALTFGSLDAPVGQDAEESNSRDTSGLTNVEAAEEQSLTHPSTSSTSRNQDYLDQPESSPHTQVNLADSHENISSGSVMKHNQANQEILQAIGGSHNQLIPPTPDYGMSFVPPVAGSHLMQLEGLEPQGGNSFVPSATGSTMSLAQPSGIAQNSIAMSAQLFPFLRQPYPPAYMPYSPYYSQLYMPHQSAQPLLGPTAFPQQPSAGNIYMQPTAASGVKFPIPQVFKQGNFSGNLPQLISSGYGSYGASALGYSSSVPLPSGASASNDDIAGSELKDRSIYSMMKQNEDLHLFASASGREIPAMPTSMFYNLPQAQPVAYSPAQAGHNSFPGIFHPTQSLSAASLVQSLQQPHQAVGGTADSIVPPLSSYPQPQLQPHQQHMPIPQQQHGQMNWNQQLMNRDNI